MHHFKICSYFFGLIIASIVILQYNYQFITNETYNIKSVYYLLNSNITYYENNDSITSTTADNFINSNCSIFTGLTNEQYLLDNKTYPNFVPFIYNKSIDLKCLNIISNKTKTILLWTKLNGIPLLPIEYGYRKPFEQLNCPVTNCELTNDRSKLNQSSLVLFHLRNRIDYLPSTTRLLNQRWVHLIYESPINCHLCDKYENNTFNFSATYTKDSDFTSLYWLDSGLYWQKSNSTKNNDDIFASKLEFAATLISSCGAPSSRSSYINELQNYIAINLYGKCGRPCPSDQNCREYISKKYKFFLVFENSICRDYITEKFFNTLKYDIIPGK